VTGGDDFSMVGSRIVQVLANTHKEQSMSVLGFDVRIHFVLLPGLALALACGESPADADAPGKTDQALLVDRYCESSRQSGGACKSAEEQTKAVETCRAKEGKCVVTLFRPELIEPLAQCLVTRCGGPETQCRCTKSDDKCFEEVGGTAVASAARDDYERQCRAKLTECGTQMLDDYCTMGGVPWRLYGDDVYQALTPCFSRACGDVGTCYRSTRAGLNNGACAR